MMLDDKQTHEQQTLVSHDTWPVFALPVPEQCNDRSDCAGHVSVRDMGRQTLSVRTLQTPSHLHTYIR